MNFGNLLQQAQQMQRKVNKAKKELEQELNKLMKQAGLIKD